jgi:hypothetical protein
MFTVGGYGPADDKDQYLIIRWLAFGAGIPTTAAIPWLILASVKAGAP